MGIYTVPTRKIAFLVEGKGLGRWDERKDGID